MKVQQIGDELAVVLDAATQRRLGVKAGDTVMVDQAGPDPVERGKAFVERYIKTFEALAK